MLSRQLRRVALDTRWLLPPTFLCPWTASLSTEAHPSPSNVIPPPPISSSSKPAAGIHASSQSASTSISPPPTQPKPRSPSPPRQPGPSSKTPPKLHPSVTTLLPLLQAQKQIYITAHIHAKPYLVTQGDTVRLPFLMKGVEPGDVLRLNRAVNLGSRDFTLRAAAKEARGKSPTASTEVVLDPTPASSLASIRLRMAGRRPTASTLHGGEGAEKAPEEVFVPHLMKGRIPYLDERLFVCRATVMGEESEPMRIKEKTKRRQRHVKHVKSKHKYTVLRISEVSVRSLEEIQGGRKS